MGVNDDLLAALFADSRKIGCPETALASYTRTIRVCFDDHKYRFAFAEFTFARPRKFRLGQVYRTSK